MIRTLSDRIAVDTLPGVGRIGDIFIPDSTHSTRNQTFSRAKVVSSGPDVKQAVEGSTIIITEYYGDNVMVDDQAYVVGRERDIVCVMDGDVMSPVGDRVLMIKDESPDEVGGVYLPEKMKGEQITATVIGVGPDCSCAIGDKVLLPKGSSVEVNLDGRKLLLIDEPTIFAIL